MDVHRIAEEVRCQGAQFGQSAIVGHQRIDGSLKRIVLLKQLQHHRQNQLLGLIDPGNTGAESLHFRSCDKAVTVSGKMFSIGFRDYINLIPVQFCLPVIELNPPKTVMKPVSVDFILPKQVVKFIQNHLKAQPEQVVCSLGFSSHGNGDSFFG